jgi:segregation and condensation protein B
MGRKKKAAERAPEPQPEGNATPDAPAFSEANDGIEPSTQEPAAPPGAEPSGNLNEPAELKLVPAEHEPDAETPEAPQESDEPVLVDPSAPEITTQQVIEAVLFVADAPLPIPRIVSILGVGSARDVRNHIETLNKRYASEGAAFRIEKIAGGYQMLSLPQYNTWLRRLRQSRQDSRFSAAALETLAVVAYKQPVTRADIEAIRGVAAGEMLNRLRELNLVKIVGRAEDVGRPMLYGTTKRFLEVFGLSGLDELPQVEQLQIAQ